MFVTTKIVATTTVTIWLRDVGKVLGLPQRNIILLFTGALLFCISLGAIIGAATATQLTAEIPDQLHASILRTSYGSVVAITGLVAVVLSLTQPSNNSLQTLLDLLPVRRGAAYLGQYTPIFVIGLFFSLALSATTFAVSWKLANNFAHAVFSTFLILAIVVIWQIFSNSLFKIISNFFGGFVRFPPRYSNAVAAIIVMAMSVGSVVPEFFLFLPMEENKWKINDLTLHRVIAQLSLSSTNLVLWVLGIAWVILAFAILAMSARQRTVILDSGAPRFLKGWLPGYGIHKAWIWLEILITIRNSQFIFTTLTALLLLPISYWLIYKSPLSEFGQVLAIAIPTIPAIIALNSVGRTSEILWIFSQRSASSTGWIAPKIIANFIVASLASSILLLITILFSLVPIDIIFTISVRTLATLAMALFVGLIIPYSEHQPISSPASSFILGVLFLCFSLVTNVFANFWGEPAKIIIAICFALIFIYLFVVLALKGQKI